MMGHREALETVAGGFTERILPSRQWNQSLALWRL